MLGEAGGDGRGPNAAKVKAQAKAQAKANAQEEAEENGKVAADTLSVASGTEGVRGCSRLRALEVLVAVMGAAQGAAWKRC